MLARSLSASPFVRGRLRAAEAACRLGRPAPLAALGVAFRAEASWLVRRLYAAMLGEARVAAAAGLLAELLACETDPRVMQPLCAAAGRHRDPRVAQALLAWLADVDRPWAATQAALASLGAQRGDAWLTPLSQALERESWWDRSRQGALAGLGATRSPGAVALILPWTTAATASLPVRVAAVGALAEAARWAERGPRQHVAEQLVDLLRDPSTKLRLAAARALGALGEPAAAAAIRAAIPTVSLQDGPTLLRIAAGLEQTQVVDQRVETLSDELRKLRERVDALEAQKG